MQHLKYLIALTKVRGIGLRTAHRLLEVYGDNIQEVFLSDLRDVEERAQITLRNINFKDPACLEQAAREVEFIVKHKLRAMVYGTADYPSHLLECPDAPLVLYAMGNGDFNAKKRYVSVVGTRTPTSYGKDMCRMLVSELAQMVPDIVVVSGLAYGIDVTAHRAALDAGVPTYGVLGHGLDRIYPSVHRDTAKKMLEQGALLTEYASGTKPEGPNFVQRDRIIAGLADVVIVVESKAKGGSLITAHYALEYNRDVMAVPGRINDTASAGCNQLIKRNVAALVESAQDIVNAMQWDAMQPKQLALFPELTEQEQQIVKVLEQYPDGLQVNDIVPLVSMPFHKISAMLFDLEDKNVVAIAPGSVYRLLTSRS